jgi:hypothetical protein
MTNAMNAAEQTRTFYADYQQEIGAWMVNWPCKRTSTFQSTIRTTGRMIRHIYSKSSKVDKCPVTCVHVNGDNCTKHWLMILICSDAVIVLSVDF